MLTVRAFVRVIEMRGDGGDDATMNAGMSGIVNE